MIFEQLLMLMFIVIVIVMNKFFIDFVNDLLFGKSLT